MKNLFSFGILLFLVNVLFAQNIEWQKSFGGDSSDIAVSIQQTTDGGYIMAGSSRSIEGDITGNHGSSDAWIVKLDSSGNLAQAEACASLTYAGRACLVVIVRNT